MAAAWKAKRVASSQQGFLNLNPSSGTIQGQANKRKRVNRNKKKNWNKYIDVNDVEDYLEDVRQQERKTGGVLSEKPDESLFFLDIGKTAETEPKQKVPEPVDKKGSKRKLRPLRIDLILQRDSLIPAPKDVSAYQQPNAKKLRRKAQNAERLAAHGKLPRKQKLLLKKLPIKPRTTTTATDANNNPNRDYYDIWGQEVKETRDPYYLLQTRKKIIQRPQRLINTKPSVLPAVEVIAPGGSYNPDFLSHQALLQAAHNVEVKRKKAEDRIEKQLKFDRKAQATDESNYQEVVQGLIEDNEEDYEELANVEEGEGGAGGAISLADKKTEKQRKKEKSEKIKLQRRLAEKRQTLMRQQLFQLRSIKSSIKTLEQRAKMRQKKRKENLEAQKSQPRRLGKLKFQAPDMEVQLSDELAGTLRQLKPEGSLLKDRFKSLQKRNLIEPRDRAKFKRRHKLKYVEKRAFREIT